VRPLHERWHEVSVLRVEREAAAAGNGLALDQVELLVGPWA
jgi:hypothetical protein